ncbi:gamma-glutamylcyclotransferase family protein [Roseitranquillus sediminis]|uniref:gamma-glutamylcyclotransferase family protein n=1 Tax=Roseitranquillus sediminis TaxID=2809051 RepID=UPI001D0C8D72|nr:gamma-glutamylcyclotransferase family protein [Roseitranquillus sediminis]MBM9593522.1 gamma-glutamylcyclotransferase [Roseitranquillus sediminis]
MSDPFFFGYGSLVNRATHTFAGAAPARAQGWRRVWRRTPLRPAAFLTVLPDPETEIDGLIAAVPGADWVALDAREAAYDRVPFASLTHSLGGVLETAIYAIPPGAHEAPGPQSPILLSYLDVVLQGYLREFGVAGVARFVTTTDGWDAPVLDDRGTPRYPRAQALDAAETAVVDRWLSDLSVNVLIA